MLVYSDEATSTYCKTTRHDTMSVCSEGSIKSPHRTSKQGVKAFLLVIAVMTGIVSWSKNGQLENLLPIKKKFSKLKRFRQIHLLLAPWIYHCDRDALNSTGHTYFQYDTVVFPNVNILRHTIHSIIPANFNTLSPSFHNSTVATEQTKGDRSYSDDGNIISTKHQLETIPLNDAKPNRGAYENIRSFQSSKERRLNQITYHGRHPESKHLTKKHLYIHRQQDLPSRPHFGKVNKMSELHASSKASKISKFSITKHLNTNIQQDSSDRRPFIKANKMGGLLPNSKRPDVSKHQGLLSICRCRYPEESGHQNNVLPPDHFYCRNVRYVCPNDKIDGHLWDDMYTCKVSKGGGGNYDKQSSYRGTIKRIKNSLTTNKQSGSNIQGKKDKSESHQKKNKKYITRKHPKGAQKGTLKERTQTPSTYSLDRTVNKGSRNPFFRNSEKKDNHEKGHQKKGKKEIWNMDYKKHSSYRGTIKGIKNSLTNNKQSGSNLQGNKHQLAGKAGKTKEHNIRKYSNRAQKGTLREKMKKSSAYPFIRVKQMVRNPGFRKLGKKYNKEKGYQKKGKKERWKLTTTKSGKRHLAYGNDHLPTIVVLPKYHSYCVSDSPSLDPSSVSNSPSMEPQSVSNSPSLEPSSLLNSPSVEPSSPSNSPSVELLTTSNSPSVEPPSMSNSPSSASLSPSSFVPPTVVPSVIPSTPTPSLKVSGVPSLSPVISPLPIVSPSHQPSIPKTTTPSSSSSVFPSTPPTYLSTRPTSVPSSMLSSLPTSVPSSLRPERPVSALPTPYPSYSAPTKLTVDDITSEGVDCSIDYMSNPIYVVEHEKEINCVRFAVNQTWASQDISRTYLNFTDCDSGGKRCEKSEFASFGDQIGEFRALFVDGFATVNIFIQDENLLSSNDDAFIPDQCFPRQTPAGFKCLWTFEIACNCLSSIPSGQPSDNPSFLPSLSPSREPSSHPSLDPSTQPSTSPSMSPSFVPSISPSLQPSTAPSSAPSTRPSLQPSMTPTSIPSTNPSVQPSTSPSSIPSTSPSLQPSTLPSSMPSTSPSLQPSTAPSFIPSTSPSLQPSTSPSSIPSTSPSLQPSAQPSLLPSTSPSIMPSMSPSNMPSTSPSLQPSTSPSSMPSMSPSLQPSTSPSSMPSTSPSLQPSTPPSSMPSTSPSLQPSTSPSSMPSTSPSLQPSTSPSTSPSSIPSTSPSMPPSSFPSLKPSTSPSFMPSLKPSSKPSTIPSVSPSVSPSSMPSSMPSTRPSQEPSLSPSSNPSSLPSLQPSATPSLSPTTSPSSLPSTSPSLSPSSFPSSIPSAKPSTTPSLAPSPEPSFVPSLSPSTLPSCSPSSHPSLTPSSRPSMSPSLSPSVQPSTSPSNQPSKLPSSSPSLQPSTSPSALPSLFPSKNPSVSPSIQPSVLPSSMPSTIPSSSPTSSPSTLPSSSPSLLPSNSPSFLPSSSPSSEPSFQPSLEPSISPSSLPSTRPSLSPSMLPTSIPSTSPSLQPSSQPSLHPSTLPSFMPSTSPSRWPSSQPSIFPSTPPSSTPSTSPSLQPSLSPSSIPSTIPSLQPSALPSAIPSTSPTRLPSSPPSLQPSTSPSTFPSFAPSSKPSSQPSTNPSSIPSSQPTSLPSSSPSDHPTSLPSDMPSLTPSVFPSDVPPCPAPTLTVDDVTSEADECSIDYMSNPIYVVEHEKEINCVRFAVNQTWASQDLRRAYLNFTDCDTGRSICAKNEFVSFDEQMGQFRASCIDGLATVNIFIQDENWLSRNDDVFIPDQCFPSETLAGFRCAWTFEITCDCPNPNCIFDGFCNSDRDCCSQRCFQNQCAPPPTASPTASPSMVPTQCKYLEDESTGLLLSCDADEQCGGYVDPVTNEQKGATCNLETCTCECDSKYCLTLNDKGNTATNTCDFDCDCTAQCDTEGITGIAGTCALSCTDCTSNDSVCSQDEDCIPSKRDSGTSYCIDSGICTDSKEAMCDDVYQVVTGSNSNRARCCPATSGCIKRTFGVIKTATCGNTCGTSCFGYRSNPGNLEGDIPTSFCTYGSRVSNMPYCPGIADIDTIGAGAYSCDTSEGNNDRTGDNSICCARDPDLAIDRGDIEGQFNCTEVGFGPLANQACVDSGMLTCIEGRLAPTCDGTDGGCDSRML